MLGHYRKGKSNIIYICTCHSNCSRRGNCAALRWGVCEWRNIRTKFGANREIGSEVEMGSGGSHTLTSTKPSPSFSSFLG